VYFKQGIGVSVLKDERQHEYAWLKICSTGPPLIIGHCYRPPSADSSVFQLLTKDVEDLRQSNPTAVLAVIGDLNVHLRAWLPGTCEDNAAGQSCHLMAVSLGMPQLVSEPTRFYTHNEELRSSCPDVFLTDCPDSFVFCGCQSCVGTADHAVVEIEFGSGFSSQAESDAKLIKQYSKTDWVEMNKFLSSVSWSKHRDVDMLWTEFRSYLETAENLFVPAKLSKSRKGKRWFSKQNYQSLRAKIRAWNRAKQSNSIVDWSEYREQRNIQNRLIRVQKRAFASAVAQRIDSRSGKPWWRQVNEVLGRNAKSNIMPPLVNGLEPVEKPSEKAELLNKHFVAKSKVKDDAASLEDVPRVTPRFMKPVRFRPKIVRNLLRKVDPSKAPGLDAIKGVVLKNCSDSLCYPLARLFQLSYDQGVVPSEWKIAKVVPIHKKKSKTDPANYRPVALLSLVSKIMERIVVFHMTRFLEKEEILSDCQFGFRPGHSTTHPLLVLHHKISDLLDKQKEGRIVALDISGAFDCVWHRRLIQKLEAYGFGGLTLRWLTDYLAERFQRVVVEGTLSDALPVTAGVPQGSLLGPLLFSIYINDLPDILESLGLVYADDVTLFKAIASIRGREAARQLVNDDLSRAQQWAKVNQMVFSAAKTQSMIVSRKRDCTANGDLLLNDSKVVAAPSLNLLGVNFSSDGSFTEHVLSKAKSAGRLVSMLARNKLFFSPRARHQLYITCIRPIMEYACPLFVSSSENALNALDKIDARARRLFPDIPIDSLRLRRDVAGLSVLYSMVKGCVPKLVSEAVEIRPLRVARTTRKTEAVNWAALEIPKSKTTAHQKAFLPYYIRLWNTLGNDTVFARSVQDFKRLASRELRTRCFK